MKKLKNPKHDELYNLVDKMLGEDKEKKVQGNACVWLAQLFPSKKKETIKNSMQKVLKLLRKKFGPNWNIWAFL